MDRPEKDLSVGIYEGSNSSMYRLTNGPSLQRSGGWFEIRLFYVRITPCAVHSVPEHLTLRHLRREIGVSLEINGSRVPASDAASVTLRRDRVDPASSEVTYVCTDNVRITGAIEFEVRENDEMILCGSLVRMDVTWSDNGALGMHNDSETGWTMDCYPAASMVSESSFAFFQPKLGISSPSIEVYVAGCCSSVPVILTKTIQVSAKRRPTRQSILGAIPEGEEMEKEPKGVSDTMPQEKIQIIEAEVDDYEPDAKHGPNFYSEDMYLGDDGQLSWFNAGVRVGVGIGLGMCLGVGIGFGILMRSYQATTRSFRRRFI